MRLAKAASVEILILYKTLKNRSREKKPGSLHFGKNTHFMIIQEINVNDITPYAKNAKKHPQTQVDYIANSLQEFGWKQPLVIDKDNVIVCGHGRLLAAKQLGMETVPCIYADDLTDDQIKAFRLADNKTNESDWDLDLLMPELDDIDLDMSLFGFDFMDEGPADEDVDIIEDEIPGAVETRAHEGDIWQLGDHRLICGDSTDPNVIDALVNGAEIDLLLTDPPYNCNVGSCERP